jgi:NAD-dependent deacetylase
MGGMNHIRNIVILTGAGISAESGLRTFRADDGLWEDHPVEEVATPQGFRRDPDLVQRFYDERRAQVQAASPNAAHLALGRLDAEWTANGQRGDLLIVTQNIDDLHERGGAARVLHMHGEALSAWCPLCDARHRWTGTLRDGPPCPSCGQVSLRPDIVWFGEMPYQMDRIYRAIAGADLFVSIGTSGAVYPAAGFVQEAGRVGARALELNLEDSLGSRFFDETRLGPASAIVPAWVEEMLGA